MVMTGCQENKSCSKVLNSEPLSENLLDVSPHSVLIPLLPWSSNACSLCAPRTKHTTFISVTHLLQMPKQTKEHSTGLRVITESV